eukprot:1395822-Ditylum_brightwellii.AAC.1
MQYFEYCIIEWKKEENIKLMLGSGEEMERNIVSNQDDFGPDGGNGPESSAAVAFDGDICGEEVIPTAILKSKKYIPPEDKAYLFLDWKVNDE